ncbi:MAG TPA: hypothetical protein VK423_04765 [Thermoplasmata archaeon]|nr:hypothetical protein [Thermoplasmata archaeon]
MWSRGRRAGHALALAIGRFGDPEFRWLSVRESGSVPSEEEGWVHRLLPESRILAPLTSDELRPGPLVPRESFDALLRTEGAAAERTALDHFLRLPARLQGLLDEGDSPGRPRIIVVANSDRVRQMYPLDPGRLRPFTNLFSQHGLSIVATSIPPPYEGRYGFDIVLRVDLDSSEEWNRGRLVVEKGHRAGEFRTGATLPLAQFPEYMDAGSSIERA